MEGEKSQLTSSLRESQQEAEQSKAEMQAILARLMQLRAHTDSMDHVRKQANSLPVDQKVKIQYLYVFTIIKDHIYFFLLLIIVLQV